jgi:glutamyl-tRNA reductase
MDAAIVLVGVSHRTASLPVRERAALTDGAARAVLRRLRADARVEEALVLSTCNRTELLAAATSVQDGEAALREALLAHSAVGEAELECAGRRRFEREAVEHLFRVAVGLESAIVGESEIAAQLRAAVARAEEERALGPVLRAACRHALAAARRVRHETGIGRGVTSTASVVAGLARAADGPVLLIGAGRVIAAVAGALAAGGAHSLMFANRTLAAAWPLAERHGGTCASLEAMDPLLARAAAVVTATDAPHPVLTAARLRAVCAHPVTVVDLAVPRDVEPSAAELPLVSLHDIDDVQARVEAGRARRWTDAQRAAVLVAGEADRFARRRRELAVEPVVRGLWQHAERLRQAELDRAGRTLSAAERRRLDLATAAFVRHLLDGPARRLRELGGDAECREALELLAALFAADAPGTGLRRAA